MSRILHALSLSLVETDPHPHHWSLPTLQPASQEPPSPLALPVWIVEEYSMQTLGRRLAFDVQAVWTFTSFLHPERSDRHLAAVFVFVGSAATGKEFGKQEALTDIGWHCITESQASSRETFSPRTLPSRQCSYRGGERKQTRENMGTGDMERDVVSHRVEWRWGGGRKGPNNLSVACWLRQRIYEDAPVSSSPSRGHRSYDTQ